MLVVLLIEMSVVVISSFVSLTKVSFSHLFPEVHLYLLSTGSCLLVQDPIVYRLKFNPNLIIVLTMRQRAAEGL